MGITIEETGEELTVRVSEGKVHIDPGLPDECDFLVPLKMANVTNMIGHAADGRLDAFETWRIASVLFTPLTRETLKNSVMSKGILRRLARIEDLIHVRLLGPEAEHVANHTLVFVSGQWLVIEGLHGHARRTFTMTGEECVAYQKQVFKAMKANSIQELDKIRPLVHQMEARRLRSAVASSSGARHRRMEGIPTWAGAPTSGGRNGHAVQRIHRVAL